jgi:hypothetical protein
MGFMAWLTGEGTKPVTPESYYPATPTIQYKEAIGPDKPYDFGSENSGEFAPVEFIKTTVSKLTANQDRIISANSQPAATQAELPWWNLTGRISNAASAANDALQSTMVKVIILVTIVGIIAIFGMSYMQAKGVSLAK